MLRGNSNKFPIEECISNTTFFVLNLYSKNHPTCDQPQFPANLITLTKETLNENFIFCAVICRYSVKSNHMTCVWKTAAHVSQDLTDPIYFHWIKNDEEYKPFMTDKLPAPQSFIKPSMSSCKKG